MYYAGSRSGVVPVPLNYRLAPPEWAYIINDSQSKMLVASADYLEAIDGIRTGLETVNRFVSVGPPSSSDSAGVWTEFDAWIGSQGDSYPEEHIVGSDDVFQMYTSGTTGHPKGVVLSHDSLTSNLDQTYPEILMHPDHRMLVVSPFYHIAAAFCSFCTVSQGGCLVIQKEFEPAEVVRTMDEDNIT